MPKGVISNYSTHADMLCGTVLQHRTALHIDNAGQSWTMLDNAGQQSSPVEKQVTTRKK